MRVLSLIPRDFLTAVPDYELRILDMLKLSPVSFKVSKFLKFRRVFCIWGCTP